MSRVVIPEHLQREDEIQPKVVEFFQQLACKVWITSERRRKEGTPGMFDLYIIPPGRRGGVWFDTKQPGETLTVKQVVFAEFLARAGVPCSWGGKAEALDFAKQIGLIANPGGARIAPLPWDSRA